MLTPEQIKAIAAEQGDTVVASTSVADSSAADAFAKRLNFNAKLGVEDTYGNRVAKTQEAAADMAGSAYEDAGTSIVGNFDELKKKNATADPLSKILNTLVFAGHTAGTIAKTTGEVAIAGAKAGLAPITQKKTTEGDTIGQRFSEPIHQKASEFLTSLQKSHPELIDWVSKQAETHPDIAKGIGDLFNTLALTGAGKALSTKLAKPEMIAKTLKNDVQKLVDTASATAEKVASVGTKTKKAATAVKELVRPAQLGPKQATIEAVNPVLKGKQLEGAWEQVATQGRKYKPAGLMSEQALAPSEQAVKVGTRLNEGGIILTGKPTGDLERLSKGLEKTETKIEKLLKGKDAEIKYLADKPTLLTSLEDIKTNAPLEFKSIKDSGKVHGSVITFSKKIIGEADDSVAGLRDARIKFDAQAKKEFPSAYSKDGTIDTKTPAGRAIKDVRDAINEHLYTTAPEGSEIKTLIQRESDIFRAVRAVAARAAAGEGKTSFQVWAKEHPKLMRMLEIGGGVGLGAGASSVILH